MILWRDDVEKLVFAEPIVDVLAPGGEDVVSDEDVVDLFKAADGRDDGGFDFVFGEIIGGEASRECC